MRSFYGNGKSRSYFEGWYFKHQSRENTLALIPAFHIGRGGRASASVQVITNTKTYHAEFPAREFESSADRLFIRVGACIFSAYGCRLDLKAEGLSLKGTLFYGPLVPPAHDIMGPFRLVPFLECRHSVLSLLHSVDGTIVFNGTSVEFRHGAGYLEGDRGASFPSRYLWTQCLRPGISIMLAAAEIPICGLRFMGCIGLLYVNGEEYRIATYLGGKPLYADSGELVLRQGELMVHAVLLEKNSLPLFAPSDGSMSRTVHENASCRVHYTCTIGCRTILDFTSDQASFEDNWSP